MEMKLINPAAHFIMGGLWVDYNLMSTIPGLFVLGEANYSDHGANRLGASALMQGLADGYFVVPYTLAGFLGDAGNSDVGEDHAAFMETIQAAKERIEKLLAINGKRTAEDIHRELGRIMEDKVGLSRSTDHGR